MNECRQQRIEQAEGRKADAERLHTNRAGEVRPDNPAHVRDPRATAHGSEDRRTSTSNHRHAGTSLTQNNEVKHE